MTRFTRHCAAALILGLLWGTIIYVGAEDGVGVTESAEDNPLFKDMRTWTTYEHKFDFTAPETQALAEEYTRRYFLGVVPGQGKCYVYKAVTVNNQLPTHYDVTWKLVEQPCFEMYDTEKLSQNGGVCFANNQWCLYGLGQIR